MPKENGVTVVVRGRKYTVDRAVLAENMKKNAAAAGAQGLRPGEKFSIFPHEITWRTLISYDKMAIWDTILASIRSQSD